MNRLTQLHKSHETGETPAHFAFFSQKACGYEGDHRPIIYGDNA